MKKESGDQKRGLSAVALNVNCRMNCQFSDPNRTIMHGKESSITIPTGKDIHCISYKTLTIPITQPMRNNYHPELTFFQCSFIQNNHCQLLFLYKIIFLSFVCWILLWSFAITCLSQIVILLFLNSPIFAGKIAHCFIFNVNSNLLWKLSLDCLLQMLFSALLYLFNFLFCLFVMNVIFCFGISV